MLKLPSQLHPEAVVLPSLIWIWVEMARPPAPAMLGHRRVSFRRAALPEGAQMDTVRRLPLAVASPHAVHPHRGHREER